MKKIVLFAAVICGLCGCVKSETVIDESEQHREIAFKPFNTKDAMRAPINSTKLPDDARLGVFAYYHGTTVQSYLKDVIFGKKGGTDNTWAGIDNDGNSRPYYWPTSGTLDLFAYHPWFEGEQIKVVDQNNEIIGFAGEAIDIANSQYDLMYTDMLIGRTAADAGTTGIPMTMHHALTQVVVNIKKTEATPKLVVTKVTLNNVFLKADAFSRWYIPDNTNNTIKKASVHWNWNEQDPGNSRTAAFAMPNVQTDATTLEGKAGVEITTDLKQYGDGALIIPYSYAGIGNHNKYECQTSITIEYTFDNGGVESEVTHTIDLNAGITDVNNKARWEIAKKYTYNITIGLNQILFEPMVDEWDEVAGKEITIG